MKPDFAPARVLLAGIKFDAGDLKNGLADLDRAVADNPAALDPYITRSVLRAEQGETARAEKDLLPLLDQFPKAEERAVTYRALAWVMLNQKKYGAARQFLQQAAQARPDSPETFYLSALTYLAENRPDAALSLIHSHLRSHPESAEGYAVAGQIAGMAGRDAESETYFKQAISINPQLRPAWEGLGLVLSAEAKYDAALDAFNKVVQLSPDPGPAYLHIAQLQERRADWNQAQTAYRKSLELEADNVVAKNNLAWSYAEHGGNIDVALRLAQEANQAKPDDPEICDTLGWIYVRKNTPGAAIQVLKKSVALAPKNPEYNYHLGMAYLSAGDTAKAKELLEATLYLEPASPLAEDVKKTLASLKN